MQLGVTHWIYGGMLYTSQGKYVIGKDFARYNPLIGQEREKYTVEFGQNDCEWSSSEVCHSKHYIFVSSIAVSRAYPCGYGSRLRFMAITVNTTIDPFTINFKAGLALHKEWEAFVTQEVKSFRNQKTPLPL